jgi:hypothetical protein
MQITQRLSKKPMITLISAFALSTISFASYAMSPYKATYTADIKSSVSFSGTLERSLSKNSNNQWLLQDNVNSLLASIDESSQLNISNDNVQPLKYQYVRKIFGKKKKRNVDFNWSQKKAVNRDKETISLIDNTQDRLSYQLQLQLDLQKGKRGILSYPVVKGGSIDILKFVEVGTETIKTPLGNLKSLKFKLDRGSNSKRETFIWFSTKHDYVISKLQQTEDDGKSYAITLEKLQK